MKIIERPIRQGNKECAFKKYHILIVLRWPVGGIRTFIRYVYKQFDPSRYQFTIVAPDLSELRLMLHDLDGLDVSYIPMESNPSVLQFFKAIFWIVLRGKYDLIHSNGLTAGVSCTVPSVLSKTPHLLTLHDIFNDHQFQGVAGIIKKVGLSIMLPLVDVIHAVSHDSRENLLHYIFSLGLFRNKIRVIPHGIEIERFSVTNARDLRKELNLPNNSFLIGFLGRFMSPKGFVYLVEAINLLYKKYRLINKPFVLAFGDGAFIREEKNYVKKKGLDEYVYFMPFTANIAPTLRGLDVVAIPSLWEACGLLPMEAMISGVPVIGTNCVGLREVLKGTPSEIIPVRDAEALADALFREMNNPSKEKARGYQKEAALRFDARKEAKELEEVLLSLLD